jgi:nucleoside-diphosphate-sugar epimerase
VCKALDSRGFELHATDLRHRSGLPGRVELADARDELSVYRLMEGMDAVVHLANYPHADAGPSPARLLAENVTMNANVFTAAADLGVSRIVFASSIQVMLAPSWPRNRKPPFGLPYLPLDGNCPPRTGNNPYALSKHFGEEMLRATAAAKPELCCTALRFPLLVGEWHRRRFFGEGPVAKISRQWLDLAEATAHLTLEDAAACVGDVLERQQPGFHQYFPAQAMELAGYDLERMVREFYPDVPLRRPLGELESLIDLSAVREAIGWLPKERIHAEIQDD